MNIFGEILQWRFIGIVSLYSEPLYLVNKILLQIVFTIWRDKFYEPQVALFSQNIVHYMENNWRSSVVHFIQQIMERSLYFN